VQQGQGPASVLLFSSESQSAQRGGLLRAIVCTLGFASDDGLIGDSLIGIAGEGCINESGACDVNAQPRPPEVGFAFDLKLHSEVVVVDVEPFSDGALATLRAGHELTLEGLLRSDNRPTRQRRSIRNAQKPAHSLNSIPRRRDSGKGIHAEIRIAPMRVHQSQVGDFIVVEVDVVATIFSHDVVDRRVNDPGLGGLRQCQHAHSGCAGGEGVHVESLLG